MRKTVPVVCNGKDQVVVYSGRADVDKIGFGMFGNVMEQLLNNPVNADVVRGSFGAVLILKI
ncbi:hypothetical protein D3C72_2034500 [compost metagenome]